MRTSYQASGYGDLIRQYVSAFKPRISVELGVLDGYSTLHIARGLQEAFIGQDIKLDAYDLFEDYEFKHGTKEAVEMMLCDEGVSQYVNIQKGNAYETYANYTEESVDFLHIDISNTGHVVRDLMLRWHPNISQRGLIMIEGGSDERDRVDWMVKYKMPPIKPELESNQIINEYYHWATYTKFPSLTVLIRKAE